MKYGSVNSQNHALQLKLKMKLVEHEGQRQVHLDKYKFTEWDFRKEQGVHNKKYNGNIMVNGILEKGVIEKG